MNQYLSYKSIITLIIITGFGGLSAQPLTLTEAVHRGLSNQHWTQIAQARVDEIRGEGRRAVSLSSPTMLIRWDDIPARQSLSSFEERRVGVSQDVDFPLRYFQRARMTKLAVNKAQLENEAKRLEVEAEIKQAYLEAWILTEQTAFLKDYSDTLKVYCGRIREMERKGEFAPLPARRHKVEAEQAEVEYQTSFQARMSAWEKLYGMIYGTLEGFNSADLELVSPFISDPIDTAQLKDTISVLINPAVSVVESDLHLCEYEKIIAGYDWLPEFQLTYFTRFKPLQKERNSWAFQLDMTVPLWFWWGGAGRIQTARAEWRRARADLELCRQEFAVEQARIKRELKTLYERYIFYQNEVLPLANEEFQLAQSNLRLGGATFEDVLEVWEELKKVRMKDFEIKTELYQTKILFDKVKSSELQPK